jgi:hypothetical protein
MSSWLRALGLESLWPAFVTEGVDAEALVSVLRTTLSFSCWQQAKNFLGSRPTHDSRDDPSISPKPKTPKPRVTQIGERGEGVTCSSFIAHFVPDRIIRAF